MTKTEQMVRELLRPSDDAGGWRRAIPELDANEAVPILNAIVRNESEEPFQRRVAATILGALGDQRGIPALSDGLRASDRILRGRAAEMLGQFPRLEQGVVFELIQGLNDADAYFRECCAKALGQLKQSDALPALEEMKQKDNVPFNREAAQKAITAIRGGQ